MNNQTIGIKSIGYTNDGLVFFQIVFSHKEEMLETTIQFKPDMAADFCKNIMVSVEKARAISEVSN